MAERPQRADGWPDMEIRCQSDPDHAAGTAARECLYRRKMDPASIHVMPRIGRGRFTVQSLEVPHNG